MPWVVIDFETVSYGPDLKSCGSWRYAEHPTTQVLCCSYKLAEWRDRPETWLPGDVHGWLFQFSHDQNMTFIAHNAQFEKAIWRTIMVPQYGFPDIPDHRWHDTMAVCAMKALPLDLERVSSILRLPMQKDMEGNRLTIGLSKLSRKKEYPDVASALPRVIHYCESDVDNQAVLHQTLGFLPPAERKVWLLDQRINQRGLKLDLEFVAAAKRVVEGASVPLNKEFKELTGLKATQGKAFLAWLNDNGVPIANLKKETVEELLGEKEEDDEDIQERDQRRDVYDLPRNVGRALAIRKLVGSASIKKLSRMEVCVCADGRARGLLQYHGASPGRWTGRMLQPQNFPRGTIKIGGKAPDPQTVVDAILTGDYAYVEGVVGPAVETVVSSLRHAIVAEHGRILVAGDFAGIEARIVLALAGAHEVVETIRQHGSRRAYLDMAAAIYKRPIDKDKDPEEYQAGKGAILGCGFQMGWETYQKRIAKDASDEECKEVIRTYREDYAPEVPKLWRGLEDASLRAVRGRAPQEAYGVRYELEPPWLSARLPSGRKLWYYDPQLDLKAMPWDELDIRECWSYKAMKLGQWKKIYAYGGHETENVVQALARDRMVHAMFLAEKENFPLVLTVHDELVCEVEESRADHKMLQQIMEDQPQWALEMNVPIAAEAWAGARYKK